MKRALLVGVMAVVSACSHGITWFRHAPAPRPAIDSLYWHAVANLDPANAGGSVDTAIANLDAYLNSATPLSHPYEASALRRLAVDASQLAKVQNALQQERANASDKPARADQEKAKDSDSVREIQRLRDELAKANAELERIRKRLATPPPAKPPR